MSIENNEQLLAAVTEVKSLLDTPRNDEVASIVDDIDYYLRSTIGDNNGLSKSSSSLNGKGQE